MKQSTHSFEDNKTLVQASYANGKKHGRKLLILFFFLGWVGFCDAQTPDEFSSDLSSLAATGFSRSETDSLLKKYNHFLYSMNPNARLAATLQGKPLPVNLLQSLLKNPVYIQSVDMLLNDTALYKNHLGCLLVGSAFDQERIPLLETLIQRNGFKDFWAATVLAVLKTKNPEPIVRTLKVLSDKPVSSYLLEAFLSLDTAVLDKFSADSLGSKDMFMRYTAIRASAKGGLHPVKEARLREIVSRQDSLKGWAISVLAEYQAGNIFPLVSPYLDDADLRAVCLRALANSPSSADVLQLEELVRRGKPDLDLLNAMKSARALTSLSRWFALIRSGDIPEDYYAFIDHTGLPENDGVRSQVEQTIRARISDKRIYPLFYYFGKRLDDSSTSFLLEMLSNPGLDRRSCSSLISNLRGRNKVLVENRLSRLMKTASIKDVALLEILLSYKLFGYKEKISQWLSDPNLEHAYMVMCKQYLSEAK